MCVCVDESVLLQTAQASVHNPHNPQLSLHVRAILDSGSQRSYMTDKIKSAFSLALYRHYLLRHLVLKEGGQHSARSFVLR